MASTYLLRIPPSHTRLDFGQHLAHEQDPVDHDPVGRALDLEVAEECVCAEQREDFVEWVVGFMAGFNGEVRDVGGERGQLDGGAAGACAKGEEGEVAWRTGLEAGCS